MGIPGERGQNERDDTAHYTNGILEVRLPVVAGATTRGKQTEVQA